MEKKVLYTNYFLYEGSNCIAFKKVWQREEKLKTRELFYYSFPNINQPVLVNVKQGINLGNYHRLSVQRKCGYQVLRT